MSPHQSRFPAVSRWLHWLMAIMVLAMLFLGVGMASSLSERYRFLVAIHRPLGLAILVLVAIRLINRLLNPPPPLPDSIPPLQRVAAKASHVLLYALMFIMPLLGWGMLSAAPYPIVIYGAAVAHRFRVSFVRGVLGASRRGADARLDTARWRI